MKLATTPHLNGTLAVRRQGGDIAYARGVDGEAPIAVGVSTLEARAKFDDHKIVSATVKPEQVPITDPLGNVRGTSLAVHFELDMMPGLTITSHRPNLQSTAYGLLADFINAVKE